MFVFCQCSPAAVLCVLTAAPAGTPSNTKRVGIKNNKLKLETNQNKQTIIVEEVYLAVSKQRDNAQQARREKQKADPLTEHTSCSPHHPCGGAENSRAPEFLTCEQ